MVRVKSLLKRVEVETVKTKRTCKNSGAAIVKGEVCIVVHDGIYDRNPYSRRVALQMIKAARLRLDEIESSLTTEHE